MGLEEKFLVDMWIEEARKTPRFKNREEELKVARRAAKGDKEALEELILRNRLFVMTVAKKYQNRGVELIDLLGEGDVGLIRAANRFNPERGVKFISYAVWWIKQTIYEALWKSGGAKMPMAAHNSYTSIMAQASRLSQKTGVDISEAIPQAIAEKYSAQINRLAKIYCRSENSNIAYQRAKAEIIEKQLFVFGLIYNVRQVKRLDESIGDNAGDSIIDRVVDPNSISASDRAEEEDTNKNLAYLIDTVLTPRQAYIIRRRYGMYEPVTQSEEDPLSLEKIASELHITRERVRQIENVIKKRLRGGLNNWKGSPYEALEERIKRITAAEVKQVQRQDLPQQIYFDSRR